MFIKKFISTVSLVALLAVFGVGEVQALTSAGNLQVSGQVVGVKPIVTNVAPSTGVNTGATAVAITGHNFTGATYVTLDDAESTILTGMAVDSDTQISATVPAGVDVGIYNVHVTTASGTNVTSDVKFTVSAPAPAANSAISSISPSGPVVTSGLTQVFTVNVSDSDSTPVYWTATTSSGTPMSAASGNAAMTAGLGSFTSEFSAGGVAGSYTATFNVDDDIAMGGPDDTETLTIYAIAW